MTAPVARKPVRPVTPLKPTGPKPSPLTFALDAQSELEQGIEDAYYQGYLDAGGDPDEYDAAMASQALEPISGDLNNILLALGTLAVGETITQAALDARSGQYSALLNPAYELGFGAAIQNTFGQGVVVTWHTAGDGDICDLCDERDGQQWSGNQDYPHPGEGYFGEQCEGGPNCRCELWYDVVAADQPGAAVAPMEEGSPDVTVAAMPDLVKQVTDFLAHGTSTDQLVLKFLVAKYSPDQPRDEHGRWTADGAVAAESLASGGSPDVSRAGLSGLLRATQGRDDIVDLAGVRVGGQPVFGGGEYARSEMPQIPSRMRNSFMGELEHAGVPVTREQVDPRSLKPIQRELNAASVAGQLDRMRSGDVPGTIISRDNYILDGHHTWAGALARSYEQPGFQMPVIRIGLDRESLLHYAWAWDARSGITPEDLGQFHEGPLAGKQWVTKAFNPDQPRDEHGRWSAGGSSLDPKGPEVSAALKPWVGYWFDDDLNPPYVRDQHKEMRAALAGEPVVTHIFGKDYPVNPEAVARLRAQGETLLKGINGSPRTTEPLYRGMRLEGQAYSNVAALKPGEVVPMNLSSWSSDWKATERYGSTGYQARSSESGQVVAGPVMFQLEPGAQALDVAGRTPLAWEHEFLTAGDFVVKDVQATDRSLVVSLHQLATFDSAAQTTGLKFDV